jgi:hypothetical protein
VTRGGDLIRYAELEERLTPAADPPSRTAVAEYNGFLPAGATAC